MRVSTATTGIVAAAVAADSCLTSAAPALADVRVAEVVDVLVGPLPCQSDAGPFEITLETLDRLHERVSEERYHENSPSIGTFHAVPVTVDEDGDVVALRPGATWSGRMVLVHTANNGSAGAGHAVSTFRLRIQGTGEDGERIHHQDLAHYTGTALPEDPAAVVRRFFSTTTCR